MVPPLRFTAFALFVSGLSLVACGDDDPAPASTTTPGVPADCARPAEQLTAVAPHTPRWAFEPWISKDISTRDDTFAFVDGFKSRGIPVGAVVLDSPWETHYNTFIPQPTRYPDFPGMVKDLHGQGVRVVTWVTMFTNETSFDVENGGDVYPGSAPNFDEGYRCDYFVNDGETFVWWKGRGAAVDFFNPNARAWWHEQQNTVLDAGLDGWKLDFGESYIREDKLATFEGDVSHQAYSERYYQDYLAYGRSKRGKDFLTMVRAWDKSYDIPGRFYAKREDAPVAWMGDNRRDWIGLVDALDHEFISSKAGYPVVGSDLGGYLDRDDLDLLGPQIPFDPLNLQRWTAQAALTPFMQLHGRANLVPWAVPAETDAVLATYRYWANLHHAMVPFYYALAEEAWTKGGPTVLRPVGDEASWPGDYRYHLGDALLVAPLLDGTSKRTVTFPNDAEYRDFFGTTVYAAGSSIQVDLSNDTRLFPVYVKAGAIIPMHADSDVLALGGAEAVGALTVLTFPGPTATSFPMREDDDSVTTITAQRTAPGAFALGIDRALKPVVFRVLTDVDPTSVSAGGAALTRAASSDALAAADGFFYDVATKTLIVRLGAQAGATVTVTP